ncbi:hypothetical protein [Boseongicola aestuarii]|uniref:Uncharacterized protein n=1 Tax=Boseongicola aestuarii TaxID=1470561 RepID=A0A238IYJ2_9RHOB|nr:hypothetical protein [Boseongicola aestuarii]SMX22935.1 hypothetical protein BOA8489_01034 [Boseongicola aestuarii]
MNFVWRWLRRLLLALGVIVIALAAPPVYVEVACRGDTIDQTGQQPLIAPEWRRAESRTLLTYPEWHIVHAYDDYAAVIAEGEPHDFAYLRAISGFWTTLCPLTQAAASMGGVTVETKATIYTIGVSFTVELLAKAGYEETLGRLAVLLRGSARAPLDDLGAAQAAEYAAFLQQNPWYKWDFAADAEALRQSAGGSLRDKERRFALGAEYRAKAAYARVIAAAVAEVGTDEPRLRSVVSGLSTQDLSQIEGVTVIGPLGDGIEIETERYRVYTRILERLALDGADILEIAGNDEILITALSEKPSAEGAINSFPRQGYADFRHLIVVPVAGLAARLRDLNGLTLEHVHDY